MEHNAEELCFPCSKCQRTFKTFRGCQQHSRQCKGQQNENVAAENDRNNTGIENEELSEEIKYRNKISEAYDLLVHWKRNLFDLPKGAAGKSFIIELTKLFNEWSSKSPNRDICLKQRWSSHLSCYRRPQPNVKHQKLKNI